MGYIKGHWINVYVNGSRLGNWITWAVSKTCVYKSSIGFINTNIDLLLYLTVLDYFELFS